MRVPCWSRPLGALVAGVLLSTACGSRVEQRVLEATSGSLAVTARGPVEPGTDTGPAAAPLSTAIDPNATAVAANAGGPSAGRFPGADAGGPSAGRSSGADAGKAASRPSATGVSGAAEWTPAARQPGRIPADAVPRAGQGPAASGAGSKAPIILGAFGVQSGILGSAMAAAPAALRAWMTDVNARGGLDGHPLKLIMADDGGDPARTQAIVRRMVDQDKVIGFLSHYSFTLTAGLSYMESKGIPLIGGTGGDENEDHSKAVFQPLLGADVGVSWSFLLNIAAQTDKKKIGIIYCREVSQCENLRNGLKKRLPYRGLTVVYEAQMSIAQPDYTAEMLGAKSAGAEVLIVMADISTLFRMRTSAERQQYSPILTGAHNLVDARLAEGGKAAEGMMMPGRLAPYSSPKLARYRAAMAQYQPAAPLGDLGAGAFVTGMLVERIAPLLGDVPSAQGLIAALLSLQGETLGGLIPPITFPDSADRTRVNLCVVPQTVRNGTFVAHDAAESFVCAPDWAPGK